MDICKKGLNISQDRFSVSNILDLDTTEMVISEQPATQ